MVSLAKLIAAAGWAALAAAPLAAQAPSPAPDKEKRICKSETRTGSLVAHKKVCKTRAQWDAEMREAQEVTRQFQEPRNRCAGGGAGGC